jgi:hypothetical protein
MPAAVRRRNSVRRGKSQGKSQHAETPLTESWDTRLAADRRWQRAFARKGTLLVVKKQLVIASAVFGVAIAGVVSVTVWTMATVTNPYVVEPLSVSPAPNGAKVGHSVDGTTRTLSIVSRNRVVVVADPGASFQYVDVWLVEKPRRDGSNALVELKCQLPAHAVAEHIHPIGSVVSAKIQRAADGAPWR